MGLVEDMLKGDKRALSRVITLVENNSQNCEEILSKLYPHTGNSQIIGVTGPPGSGKSTLINHLVREFVRKGYKVGVLAIDPSSEFTGGALLGDRIRMLEVSLDSNVFIRSMGTRGTLGGISRKTKEVVRVLEAFGKDKIIIETIGAGQSDIEITRTAHTVIVVLTPETGDDVQVLKAGIMEIGDIYVVNKADIGNAEFMVEEIKALIASKSSNVSKEWTAPVIKASAKKKEGIRELVEQVEKHWNYLKVSGEINKLEERRVKNEVVDTLNRKISNYLLSKLESEFGKEIFDEILKRKESPYSVVNRLIKKFLC